MNILIVDDEPEVTEWLTQTVQLNTQHKVHSATSAAEAIAKAQNVGRLHLLISDVVMDQIDGFTLRQSLQAQFPELVTIFVSGYDLTDFKEHVNGTEVLAKPVDPSALLALVSATEQRLASNATKEGDSPKTASQKLRTSSANLRNLVQKQGFTGKLDQFQLVDIIQMCCLSRRTGRLQIAKGIESGVIFLKDGHMTHAVTGELEGELAVYKIISWDFGQFSFEDGLHPDHKTISVGWEHLVMEGVRRRDEKGETKKDDVIENLVGKTIAGYKIIRKMGEGDVGEVFEAVQTSIDRPVAFKLLWPALSQDPALVQDFIANASAKANVTHPSILAVYEAGQTDGKYFYAREYVDGATLADLQAHGKSIDEPLALQTIRVTSEAMLYLNQSKIPHKPLTAASIYIGADRRPRMANTAALNVVNTNAVSADIHALSKAISSSMQGGATASPTLRALLSRMLLEGVAGFPSWGALLQEVKTLEPRSAPIDAHKLSERAVAAKKVMEEAKKKQKKTILYTSIGTGVLLFLVVAIVCFRMLYVAPAKDFDIMEEIPAGPFLFGQDAKKMELPTFYIDKYEVTIGQYAKFVEELSKNPSTKFDHADQPSGMSHHIPRGWDTYYSLAKAGKSYQNAPITLDTPVSDLTWFDAYAYAKWKGRRLPTEEEWEKAASGPKGLRYPWGNEHQTKGVNTNADYSRPATGKGNIDGWQWWSPVDQTPGDKSPYGVMNLAGNVSEWTGTWENEAGRKNPVVKGGSFLSPDNLNARRSSSVSAEGKNPAIGFRTASDKPPEGTKIEKVNP